MCTAHAKLELEPRMCVSLNVSQRENVTCEMCHSPCDHSQGRTDNSKAQPNPPKRRAPHPNLLSSLEQTSLPNHRCLVIGHVFLFLYLMYFRLFSSVVCRSRRVSLNDSLSIEPPHSEFRLGHGCSSGTLAMNGRISVTQTSVSFYHLSQSVARSSSMPCSSLRRDRTLAKESASIMKFRQVFAPS